jgi:uncharacterized protein
MRLGSLLRSNVAREPAVLPAIAPVPLELDGFLTGIAVSPEFIPPEEWIVAAFATEIVSMGTADELERTAAAAFTRHEEICEALDEALARLDAGDATDYRAAFEIANGRPPRENVRNWVRGFGKAIPLAMDAWDSLFQDVGFKLTLAPIVCYLEVDGEPLLKLEEGTVDLDELRDAAVDVLPATIVQLRGQALLLASENARKPVHKVKIGRNDPCPCGSGKKYKRCCAE